MTLRSENGGHLIRQSTYHTNPNQSQESLYTKDSHTTSDPDHSHKFPNIPAICRVSDRVASSKTRVWSGKGRRKPVHRDAIDADESLSRRFWSKVQKSKGCWEWKAAKDDKGYGLFKLNRVMQKAHRVSWRMTNGATGPLDLLHACDNPSCVRPDHMRLGTHSENMKDCGKRGRLPIQNGREPIWVGGMKGSVSRSKVEEMVAAGTIVALGNQYFVPGCESHLYRLEILSLTKRPM